MLSLSLSLFILGFFFLTAYNKQKIDFNFDRKIKLKRLQQRE